MKLSMYTIQDVKVGAYMQPFYTTNEATAIRAIKNLLTDPDHQFSKNPEDFALYHLGVYDDEDGKHLLNDAPNHMHNLIDLLEPQDG
jgi:hypothetical protein